MYQILIFMLIFFMLVLAYSAVVRRFTKNKVIFFLPAIVTIFIYGAIIYWHVTTPSKGIQGLTIYFTAIFAIVIIGTNIVSFYVFAASKRDNQDN